ncbi:hypothetical protein [Rheinheimera tangshanensis]|uniref:hypothetical protein n=1 Tax=Rheinheimera tangshanensis TaxID=400153 RepID=UPI0019B2E978|nr:hypothetical protein [Rheinheimera tangshanensis]GGM53631.1 hypothetical protein GCM10010920_12540 [Rheinheimera tangshanensis]
MRYNAAKVPSDTQLKQDVEGFSTVNKSLVSSVVVNLVQNFYHFYRFCDDLELQ